MLEQFVAFVDTEKWELDSIQIAEVLWFVRTVTPLIRGEADGAYQFCLLAFLKGVENLGLCLVWGTILEKWETPQIEFTKYQQELMMITLFWTLIEKGLYSLALLLFLEKKGVGKKLTKPPLSELKYPLTSPSNKPVSSTAIEPNPYPTEQLPIKLPDTGIFRNTLELGRLLKPLKQKINSRIAQELNIKETVRRSAELSTPTQPRYFPVLTPKKERWLDVALLIEDSESMILWQSLLKEVQDFLEHLGAFRDIKTYRMNWDDLTKTLQISSFYSFSQYLSPQALNAPGSRRLILIVSDCISPAWISEQFIDILQQWSSQSLLTVLNPFPERIWERTNLDYAIKIRLGNKKKGLTPQSWQAIPLESWQVKGFDKQALLKLVKLPIVSLESESIKAWVNVIMGKGISWCSGVWLGSNFMYSYEEEEDDEKSLTPLQQINNFYATSSQLAWELIQWLSAIPVSFSTIRLVQRTLLPESTQVHVAEVVMGGLLSPITPLNYYQSNYPIQFEFKPGIREAFLDQIAADKQINKKEFCLRVIGSLTEKIASHFGYQTIREFEATLLTNPLELSGEDGLELIQAFATISVSTLRQYGEEYDTYIRKLDKSRARLNLVSAVEGNSIGFNWIDFLESIAQRHHLTDIETETLINLLPTPSQFYSISDVAKQLLISESEISNRLTDIYRKFQVFNHNLFPLEKSDKLKTLQEHLYFQYKKFTLPIHPGLDFFELFEFESEVATVYIEEDTEDSLKKLQTILLVEDQAEVIEEISILLSSQYGITVRGTADVNDVINIAQSGEIDFILVNDHLPNIRYQGREVNGIKLVRLLRSNPKISPYLPVIGFSHHISKKNEFLQEADGFYSKADILERKEVQQFIDYLRKIFNRVKITEILPYESKSDLDSVLDLMSKRHSEGLDTSEEEVANLFGKNKNDDGTYYLLENLSLLSILNRKSGHDVEPGTVKYDLSNDYLKQESPRPLSLPEIEEFETIRQQLYDGQKKLLKEIEKRNKEQQTISQADVAFLFNHPEGGNIATYRRLEHLRLLGFITITDVGTSQETIRYNLSQKYGEYLGLNNINNSHNAIDLQPFQFETPTVNRRGEIIKTTTHTANCFTETLPNNVDLDMVSIPGGTFTMGSPKNEKDSRNNERPQHNVTVPPFFIGKYPITQGQWQAIASRTDLKINIDLDEDPSYFKKPYQDRDREIDRWLRPVEQVNWYEAVEFCQRLSKLTGRDYRLPSEAQWEYACRAMTEPLDLAKGESYPPFYFGETLTDKLANYNDSRTYADEPKGESRNKTTPVGQFPPNAFGLYDMHGNVWEWCMDDWHDNYDGAPTDGSAWLDNNQEENAENSLESTEKADSAGSLQDENNPYPVMRGGSWGVNPDLCRSAIRYSLRRRDYHYDLFGFRVVCSQ